MKSCNSCGKCCVKYSDGQLSATSQEIEYWELHRPDIFEYVHDGEIWHDPASSHALELCPFLYVDRSSKRYLCSIYNDRPEDCRIYPATLEDMIKDGCEMLEPGDLTNPKKAQKELNNLMSDSRKY